MSAPTVPVPVAVRHDVTVTLAAAAATALGAAALAPVFSGADWLPGVLAAVAVVAGVGLVLRVVGPAVWGSLTGGRPPSPRWAAAGVPLVPIGQLVALCCLLTALFAPARAIGGWLPTAGSVADLGSVLLDGAAEIREQVTPALPLTGLCALTALMIGIVAVSVDLLAVGGRQPALAALGLLVIFSIPVGTVDGGLGIAPIALPAAGLALLLWADQHRRLVRRRGQGPTPRTGTGVLTALRTGVLALAAALVLGPLVPMFAEGELIDRWQTGSSGGRSTGTSLDPAAALQGQLTRAEPIDLLRVDASVPDPGYLRAVALETYDAETGWSIANLDSEESLADDGDLLPLPGERPGRTVAATVTVIEHDDRFLPVLYSPLSVDIDDAGAWRFDRASATVFGRDATTAGHRYRLVAVEPRPTPSELAATGPAPPGSPELALAAPPPLAPSVSELVLALTAGAQTPHERVQAIYGFLTDPTNGWRYSLTTAPGTSGDDLADFLQNRLGYCEQYAGAMAVMVRAAGVPARVALGYTPGTVQPDGSRLITSSDAHAWVEVFFNDLGWVAYDPTPIDLDRAVTQPWAPRPQEREVAPRSDLPAGPAPLPEPVAPAVEEIPDGAPVTPAGDAPSDWVRALLPAAAAVLAVITLVALPAGLRTLQRRRRLAGGSAAAVWDELAATAHDLGLPWEATRTPRQVADRLVESLPGRGAHRSRAGAVTDARAAVTALARGEEAASYARPGSGPDAGELARLLHTARRGLLAAAPRRARLRALLLPASVPATLAAALANRWPRLARR